MNCEQARQRVVGGGGFGFRARRHVRECPDCAAWFAALRETELLLAGVAAHEMPAVLEPRLREAFPTRESVRAGRMGGIGMKLMKGAIGVAALAVIVVAALFVWSPGKGGVAWAEVYDALSRVRTVHITGETYYAKQNTVVPLALHKDKWLRREPFAVYEEVTPVSGKAPAEASRYVLAGNSGRVVWYFPARGNRATIGKGLPANFMDDLLAPMGASGPAGSAPPFKNLGPATVDGREVTLLELRNSEKERIELAVQTDTKLVIRVRQFAPGPDGREAEIGRLRFEYNQTPPKGVFDWTPPAGATVVDKR